MDPKPAATGRRLPFSGASELAPTADRVANLQVHADLPRSRSDFIAWDGQKNVFDDAGQAADPLPHVLVLRALYEAAEIHSPSLARVSEQNR